MTEYNKFLHMLNLWLNPCESSFTKQKAIPKGSKSDPSAELTIAYTLVLISDFTIKFL